MEQILDYLKREHEVLKREKDPTELCIGIAAEVAVILTRAGKAPDIMVIEDIIRDSPEDGGKIHRRQFKPILFNGKIGWEGHEFCCYEGKVYDPLVGEPVPIGEYCNIAFGENLPMKVVISEEYVKQFLNG